MRAIGIWGGCILKTVEHAKRLRRVTGERFGAPQKSKVREMAQRPTFDRITVEGGVLELLALIGIRKDLFHEYLF